MNKMQQALDTFGTALGAVLTPLAATIRTVNLGIGHSTVTAALLVSVTIGGLFVYYDMQYVQLNTDKDVSETERNNEQGAYWKAHRLKIEAQLQREADVLGKWDIATVEAQADSIVLLFPKVPGTTMCMFSWTVGGTTGNTGMFAMDANMPMQTKRINKDAFGGTWQQGAQVSLVGVQVTDDGRTTVLDMGVLRLNVRIP